MSDAVPTGFAPRPGWGFVVVTGPDAWRFLQDLVSQDLDPLVDGTGAHSLLLSPQGKLNADLRVLRVGEEAWLDGPDGPGLTAALARFRIRVDAEITDRSEHWILVSVRGVDAEVLGVDLPAAQHTHTERDGVRVVRADWANRPGFDVLGPRADVDRVVAELERAQVARLDRETFDRVRIEAGIPLQGVDVDEATIPQEAFLDHDAVSFTKGCFLGQELVCRIDTRGRVNRFLRRIEIPDVVPAAGTELLDTAGKVRGVLTSVAPRAEGGAIALAMVRREVEPPAELMLPPPTSVSTAVLELHDPAR